MDPAKILVIEDDDIVARTIQRSLRGDEFEIRLCHSGFDGLKAAREWLPDLVILDVIMPGMDGYGVCREMRADAWLASIPVLFLTARVRSEDRLNGFRSGADDYLCKPFNLSELILRVRAILRRTKAQPAEASSQTGMNIAPQEMTAVEAVPYPAAQAGSAAAERSNSRAMRASSFPAPKLAFPAAGRPRERAMGGQFCLVVGDYKLDTRTFELETPHHGWVPLTPIQYDLLYHLMTHPGEFFSPARLLDEVWDYPTDRGSPDLVRVHIKTLRERIEENPRAPTFIRTVPGYGYTVGTGS